MEGSIRLTAEERKRALQVYRGAGDARMARRAHILLLLADGRSYREIIEIDYSGSDLQQLLAASLTLMASVSLMSPSVQLCCWPRYWKIRR